MEKTITNIIKKQKDFIKTKEYLSIKDRQKALKKFKFNFKKYEKEIKSALFDDLNKSSKESFITELIPIYDELNFAIKNIKKMAKPKKVKKSLNTLGSKTWIAAYPRGVSIIISPFNYPVNLSIIPLISSVAAGNTTILKFSEYTPNVNEILKKIIQASFSEKRVAVINENHLESFDDIYKIGIDFIFFTGSNKVGKIIAKKSIQNNIPYALELGGKSPVIISEKNGYQKHLIERLVWSKLINAGQTCVAPDYFLVHKIIVTETIFNIKKEIERQYPNVFDNQNIPKIVTNDSFKRMKKILKKYENQIVYGGFVDEKTQIVEPTIILISNYKELKKIPEVFGPIFFIAKYGSIINAVKWTKEIDPTPLAAYLFSSDDLESEFFINNMETKNIAINNAVIQVSNLNVPFGGHKTSGIGQYHGKYGFETFSLMKNILYQKSRKNLNMIFPNRNPNSNRTEKHIKILKKFRK